MLRRILIANRGEIAVRIARTVRDLGLASVAVHAAGEARGLHVRVADAVAPLPGTGVAAYLDIDAVVAAALASGCDAVHPGYGFLSESAAFARAVEAAGLTFVGPTPDQLDRLGDKLAARALAEACGVPVLAATGVLADAPAFAAFVGDGAAMLKAIHGGGGRGMRAVRPGDDAAAAFAAAAGEARAAFGNPALYAERLLEGARHIEVQLVGDGAGGVATLGTRDCSLQFRRQKLIEFAPAAGLAAGVEARLLDHARALGEAVALRGVATAEFLVAGETIVFLEVNPRLQVEHTVTEAVFGVDLVAVQLAIAGGARLADLALPTMARGVAVEVRVGAARVGGDGLLVPAAGRIERLVLPAGPGVRVDAGVAAGDAVDPAFDPLILKLIVHADDAATLGRRTTRALAELEVAGVDTTAPLAAALLARDLDGATTASVEAWLRALIGDAATMAGPRIVAPLTGVVVAVDAGVGTTVARGAPLVTIEAMKLHHVVTARVAGRVASVAAAVGDHVTEGALLAVIDPDEAAGEVAAAAAAVDLDAVPADLAALRARLAFGLDAERVDAVAKRARLGMRTARANLLDLCDTGSFDEYGALAVAAQRRRRDEDELARATPGDGMVAGFGTVGAEVFGAEAARTCVLAYDYSVLAGTQGWFNHKKTDRVLAVAVAAALPTVFFTEGGGGRPGDVDADQVSVTGLDVTSFAHWAAMNGVAPRIAVNAGRCFAGNAVIFGLADLTVATRASNIGLGGPAMIEGGGLGRFPPEAVGPAPVLAAAGAIDLLVDDEAAGVAAAKALLGYFQGRVADWAAGDARRLRHVVPADRRRAHDMRAVVDLVADTGSVTELRPGYGRELITALVRIEGRPCGLIANDPGVLGGAIGSEGATKAARFLQLCDAYGFAVVSLVDTPGFMVGPDSEATAAVRRGSRLIAVGANLRVPIVAVVVRRGFGLGAQAMAGGSFRQPVATLAWPGASFGAMGIEGAVRLGFSKELAAADDPAALEAKLIAAMTARGAAVSVAAHLEIDAVIDPADTRTAILKALRAAPPLAPGRRFVDVW